MIQTYMCMYEYVSILKLLTSRFWWYQ